MKKKHPARDKNGSRNTLPLSRTTHLCQLVSVEAGEGVDRVEADLGGGVAGLARPVRRGHQAARRDHRVRPPQLVVRRRTDDVGGVVHEVAMAATAVVVMVQVDGGDGPGPTRRART